MTEGDFAVFEEASSAMALISASERKEEIARRNGVGSNKDSRRNSLLGGNKFIRVEQSVAKLDPGEMLQRAGFGGLIRAKNG